MSTHIIFHKNASSAFYSLADPTHPHSSDHCDIAQWKNLQGFEVDHEVNSVNHRPEYYFGELLKKVTDYR